MYVKLLGWGALSLGMGLAVAVAQEAERSEPAEAQPVAVEKAAGRDRDTFWPPNWLINAWLKRNVRELGRRHNFSDEQNQKLFDMYAERIPKFMEKNRENLEPVLAEVLYSAASGEAPSVDVMTQLATAAKPLVGEVQGLIHGVFDDFKEDLDPTQLVRMQKELTGMDFAMKMTARKLDDWSDGNYDPENLPGLRPPSDVFRGGSRPDVWNDLGPRTTPRRRSPGTSSRQQAASRPEPIEKDRFDKYVETFIAKYDLYPGQKKMAYAILAEIKKRAQPEKGKARRKLAEIEKQQKELAKKAKAGELAKEELETAKAKIEKGKAEATARLDTFFGELQKRLSLLLERKQRQMVEGN